MRVGRLYAGRSVQRPVAVQLREHSQGRLRRTVLGWALAALTQLGIQKYYVPTELGGMLSDLEDLWLLGYTMARRDIGLAISHGIAFLAGVQIWANGTRAQQQSIASSILDGEPAALCITEEQVGHDLTKSSLRASPTVGGGYELHGEKYLINNAGRAHFGIVLARHADAASNNGVEGLVLAQVDLKRGRSENLSMWQRVPLSFVRTAEVGRITLGGVRVGPEDVIARDRVALNNLLEGFEFSKIMVSSLAIGAFDTALRLALKEVQERRLYKDAIIKLPHVRDIVVRSFLTHLGAQCLTRLALIGASATPDRLWARANACKAYCGGMLERAAAELSTVMGTRTFVRGRVTSMFEKIERDLAFPRQIHSSAVVCLHHLTPGLRHASLGTIAGTVPKEAAHLRKALVEDLGAGMDLSTWHKVDLRPKLSDSVFAMVNDDISMRTAGGQFPARSRRLLDDARWMLREALARWSLRVSRWERGNRDSQTAAVGGIRLTEEYCRLLAAAAVTAHAQAGVFSRRIGVDDALIANMFCRYSLRDDNILPQAQVKETVNFLLSKSDWSDSLCVLDTRRDKGAANAQQSNLQEMIHHEPRV